MTPSDLVKRIKVIALAIVKLNQKSEALTKAIIDVKTLSEENQEQIFTISAMTEMMQSKQWLEKLRGKDGKDYLLTEKDKKEIIKSIPVRVVEKVIQKTETVVKEVPVVTNNVVKEIKTVEVAAVNEEKIANTVIEIIKEKELLSTDDVKGLRNELTSYRSQLALKQAGQHGGGDTVRAGTNIELVRNNDGTTTINSTGGGGVSGQATVNFGLITSEDSIATVTVAEPTVTASSIILVSPAGVATDDHDPDDYQWDNVSCYVSNIVDGVSFDIIGATPNGTWGRYVFNYLIN